MSAATVVQSGWLDEMTDLYGKPRALAPIRNGRMVSRLWRWTDCSVTTKEWTSVDPQERMFHVTVWNGARFAELRDLGMLPDGAVDEVLRLARLLPCQECRGLGEVPAGQDGPGEVWACCGSCTGPSPRPRQGVAVTG